MALLTVEEIDRMLADGEIDEKRAEDFKFLADHFAPEELHEDLKPYLGETTMRWMALKHPLVFVVPWHDHSAKQANQMYAYKTEAVAAALAEKEWLTYIYLHERAYRAQALATIADKVTDDEEYWLLLRDVWIDSENIWQWGTKNLRALLEADRPGRAEGLMDEMERANIAQMTQEVTIYRGYVGGRGTQKGWSWTLNPRKAEWFAQRISGSGDTMAVATATINKDDIIALFHGRQEAEVIIDPRRLRRIKVTRTVKP
jgi:hypothetical protein